MEAIFVHALEKRQGLKVACLEEIAFINNWIDTSVLKQQAQRHQQTAYGDYLFQLAKESDDEGY
ncbi:hypothetical protein [Shewanella japonica]|uniref:DUF3283 family protein n=1 Tax=Shewanella japonica TaxID=93973 RepID=A0ABN4YFF2_9GAMM|nr:hypothetical protein [Shewanella japonica]ARD21675.1 hypothetical protein SJ2017_1351 [Shewanella japonica]